jgi:hypothetical protein
MFKKVEIEKEELFIFLNQYREKANYSLHEFSRGEVSEVIPMSEKDLLSTCLAFYEGVAVTITGVLSDIEWEKSGGCVGDELYPVNLEAVKLPDGRYWGKVSYYQYRQGELTEEFIFTPPKN